MHMEYFHWKYNREWKCVCWRKYENVINFLSSVVSVWTWKYDRAPLLSQFVLQICNWQNNSLFQTQKLQQTHREIWNECYLQPDMKLHLYSKFFKTNLRETGIFQEKVNISHCKFEIDELRAQTLESPSPPPLAKHTASPAGQLSVFWWMWSVFWWMGSLLFHKYLICQSWSYSDSMAFHRSQAMFPFIVWLACF